jgi:hypothetical protein
VNFGTTPGIIEILWKSNEIAHHTIGPPDELKSTKTTTHFGCSFQISHLQKLSTEEIKKRTMNQEERSCKQSTCKRYVQNFAFFVNRIFSVIPCNFFLIWLTHSNHCHDWSFSLTCPPS